MEKMLEELKSAVRWAPSSAYWSDRLQELLGEEAMVGINALSSKHQEACNKLQKAKELLVQAASRFSEEDNLARDIKRFLNDDGM